MNLKEKRIMILDRVDKLLKQRCEKCTTGYSVKSIRCDCYASKEIRKCGQQLSELLPRKQGESEGRNGEYETLRVDDNRL